MIPLREADSLKASTKTKKHSNYTSNRHQRFKKGPAALRNEWRQKIIQTIGYLLCFIIQRLPAANNYALKTHNEAKDNPDCIQDFSNGCANLWPNFPSKQRALKNDFIYYKIWAFCFLHGKFIASPNKTKWRIVQ